MRRSYPRSFSLIFLQGRKWRCSGHLCLGQCSVQISNTCMLTRTMDRPLLLLLLLRFHSFLLFLGQPSSSVRDIKVTTFCRIIGEFSLEYRTTRERVLTLKRKRAAHRERTKTRGKMITEVTLLLLLWEGGHQQDLLSFFFTLNPLFM